MKVSIKSIQALSKVITGDSNISPYRSGPKLVTFFNEYGAEAQYGNGFPSRWSFAETQLSRINNTNHLKCAIEESVNPANYIETEYDVAHVVDHLNKYLVYDGFEITKNGIQYRVISKKTHIVTPTFIKKLSVAKDSHLFIIEQVDKCREKLESSDYDGAITNARSMVEAVLEEIICQKNIEVPNHEGDLNKLYKEIKKHMNLDPGQVDLADTLKQTLSGLNSIVIGIAGLSNKMGDRHSRKYKPAKHHALLAINTSYALCEFLISSSEYQHKN